ncbi:hypothetical protein U9M48_025517 [Paspalum notatum var. saurae]|uniref:Uncharacterized protein n=1 Tax=Paspalum notatum var. saurae TaxID=547442 RepID=A0AAQ3TTE5_PASNO
MGKEMPTYGEIRDHRYRLIDYVGDGFLVNASYGSAVHFVRGLISNSSHGGRLAAGVRAARTHALRYGGAGGTGMAIFWACESAMFLARGRREDPWNFIAAGAGTFGLCSARRGAAGAALFALLGAASCAGIAGAWWASESWYSHCRKMGRETPKSRGLPPPPAGRFLGSDHLLYGVQVEKSCDTRSFCYGAGV